MTAPKWERCWCGAQAAHRYMDGPKCPDHTPARMAGRPEPSPDPRWTMAGIRQAHAVNVAARAAAAVERARRRDLALLGITHCRPASGPGGRYTSADVDMGKVRAAIEQCGREIHARAGR